MIYSTNRSSLPKTSNQAGLASSTLLHLCNLLNESQSELLLNRMPGRNSLSKRIEHNLSAILDPKSRISEIFCSAFEEVLAAPVILKRVSLEGNRIGILSARGARENNQLIISEIVRSTGVEIPLEYQYYIGDRELNGRIAALSGTSRRKIEVLKDLFQGSRSIYQPLTDSEGGHEFIDLPDPGVQLIDREYRYTKAGSVEGFAEIHFYDDEYKNISAAEGLSSTLPPPIKLNVYDVNQLSTPDEVRSIISILRSPVPLIGNPKVIHMFDLDGTLSRIDARVIAHDLETGSGLELTQRQFAELSLTELRKFRFDFGHFENSQSISDGVTLARKSGILFLREKTPQDILCP